jgi:endonuclease/exonuclease/phosphatase family metal-dependent hydrolase
MGMSLDSTDDISHTRPSGPRRLRLLSYNIQAGIATSRYRHYLTHSWKHLLPHPQRLDTLDRMATILGDYDIVGLQEADGGSLRSNFINLTEYLAVQSRYPYWFDQTNRNLGGFARHSLGFLSRYRPTEITEIRLPGMIPGRGSIMVRFGWREDALVMMITHLALGRRGRLQQLGRIADLVSEFRHVIVMGDFNCSSDSLEVNWLRERTMHSIIFWCRPASASNAPRWSTIRFPTTSRWRWKLFCRTRSTSPVAAAVPSAQRCRASLTILVRQSAPAS